MYKSFNVYLFEPKKILKKTLFMLLKWEVLSGFKWELK